LGFGRKERLLLILPVNIAQRRRKLTQQGSCHRTIIHKGARFPRRGYFALDDQFVFGLNTGFAEQSLQLRR
jgi:hypothetical protein